MTTTPSPFAIIGSGWRAGFFLRVAASLPDRFRVTGVLVRDARGRGTSTVLTDAPVHTDLDALLAAQPRFVVLAVSREASGGLMRTLADRGVPVLAETPPAGDLAALDELVDLARSDARIQVAEQYRFQPFHAARLAVAASGRLGAVSQAQVSVAHDYHGMDLIRRYLDVGFEPVTITASRFTSPIVVSPDRHGPPVGERVVPSVQMLAWLDFGDRLGVHDFTDDQYFSWIRAPRVLLRGERGEIHDTRVRWLADATTPLDAELTRRDTGLDGNLEGYHHAGITLGETWVYRNPFVPARLSDDEIAVATCLERMTSYVDGGPSFCSLAEAAWDQELAIRVAEAADTRRSVRASGERWRRS